MKLMRSAFYANPSKPTYIGETISAALDARSKKRPSASITPWPKLSNIGLRLDDKCRHPLPTTMNPVASICSAGLFDPEFTPT
jgi:hypothetical protein